MRGFEKTQSLQESADELQKKIGSLNGRIAELERKKKELLE